MIKALFSRKDCILWKNNGLKEPEIMWEIVRKDPHILDRDSNDKYPFVFGSIKDSPQYGLIHRKFVGRIFSNQPITTTRPPEYQQFNQQAAKVFSKINLCNEEVLLLQFYCGIKQYGPISPIAMPITLGLVFTLLLNVISEESIKIESPLLSFSIIALTIMVVYPTLILMWRSLPGVKTNIKWDIKQLISASMETAFIIGMVLGVFPIMKNGINTEDPYLNSLLTGISLGSTYWAVNTCSQLISKEISITRPWRPNLARIITPLFSANLVFACLLVFQQFLLLNISIKSKESSSRILLQGVEALMITSVLTFSENLFLYIISRGFYWLLNDSLQIEQEED